jgi:hypothetical protein
MRLPCRKPHLLAIQEDKLFFILFYFKAYLLQEVMAAFFGMIQGRANEWIYKLTPILERALGAAQGLPERNPQNLEQVLALCAFTTSASVTSKSWSFRRRSISFRIPDFRVTSRLA